jgi:hypothetical protein
VASAFRNAPPKVPVRELLTQNDKVIDLALAVPKSKYATLYPSIT